MVVRDKDGRIKDYRQASTFVEDIGLEFIPNQRYLNLINANRITPGEWKVPFLFGKWRFVIKRK